MAQLRHNQVAHIVHGIQLTQQTAQFILNPCPPSAFIVQGIDQRGQFNEPVNAGIFWIEPHQDGGAVIIVRPPSFSTNGYR